MKKHQVDPNGRAWRGNRDESARNTCAKRLTEERMVHKELVDRKRAEYLQLHDDDEAELDLPR